MTREDNQPLMHASATDNFNFTDRVHHSLTMRPNPAAAGFQPPMFTRSA
jgi:hypothetical protein